MATLTYNPDEPQAEEFTAEEQENIAVGEQLEQQEQALLAGKFKDAEDLEKAYIELQTKLGKPKEENETAEPEPEPEPEDTREDQDNFADTLWEEAQGEQFSKETLERLKGMNPGELAKMYLDYRSEQAPTGPKIDEAGAQSLREMVGGNQSYENMVQWAQQNYNEADINRYNSVMNSGDPDAMYFAVQALNSRYTDTNGMEAPLITGRGAPQTVDAFQSQAEVVRAMSDDRYDTDPAYRAQIAQKLERSNLDF